VAVVDRSAATYARFLRAAWGSSSPGEPLSCCPSKYRGSNRPPRAPGPERRPPTTPPPSRMENHANAVFREEGNGKELGKRPNRRDMFPGKAGASCEQESSQGIGPPTLVNRASRRSFPRKSHNRRPQAQGLARGAASIRGGSNPHPFSTRRRTRLQAPYNTADNAQRDRSSIKNRRPEPGGMRKRL